MRSRPMPRRVAESWIQLFANSQIRCVQLLIEAGADPSLHVGVSQRTAEIYAGLHGHAEILDYLLRLKR